MASLAVFKQLFNSGNDIFCIIAEFIKQERIACQQIANIHKKRRINYTIIPKDYILGNSYFTPRDSLKIRRACSML